MGVTAQTAASALGRPRKEDHKFENSLRYTKKINKQIKIKKQEQPRIKRIPTFVSNVSCWRTGHNGLYSQQKTTFNETKDHEGRKGHCVTKDAGCLLLRVLPFSEGYLKLCSSHTQLWGEQAAGFSSCRSSWKKGVRDDVGAQSEVLTTRV